MSRFTLSVLFIISFAIGMPRAEAWDLPIAAVTASSEQIPNVAGNTLDGDLNTRWSAQGDGQWIRYELESCSTLYAVDIAWFQGDTRTASFAIETSEDGVSWVTVSQADSSGDWLGLQVVHIADQYACFVCIVGFGTSVNAWNSIIEVEISGFVGRPVERTPGVRIPIARVYASHEQHPNVAANAIDGDFNTRWSALADRWIADDMEEDAGWDPQPEDRTTWITFELEECQEVWGGVNIAWYQGDRRVSFYGIEFSEDGVNWGRGHHGVGFGISDPGELGFVSVDSPFACFVRITGYGNTFNPWTSITEVWIEGRPIDEGRLMN